MSYADPAAAEDRRVARSSSPAAPRKTKRSEVYGLSSNDLLAQSVRGVAAVVPREYVRYDGAGVAEITAPSLQRAEQVCMDEPFSQQPSAATCTAVLIDDNLLATAGHCFKTAWDCQNYFFVFDYAYRSRAHPAQLGPLEVYECRRARVHENDLGGTERIRDYAVIELTQRVRGRAPLTLRKTPLSRAEPLSVISAAEGVPLKVESAARALNPRAAQGDYFFLDSETLRGSSGAPVLDQKGELVGLFARGDGDYQWDQTAGCQRASRAPRAGVSSARLQTGSRGLGTHRGGSQTMANASVQTGTRLEQASYASAAMSALCQSGYPSLRLCGVAPRCGDAICSSDETELACQRDCSKEGSSPRR